MNLRNRLTAFAMLAAATFLSSSAHAGLVQTDWQTPGDGQAILDTSTGLSWLNLSVTQGMSIDQVSALLASQFQGYTIATLEQVDTLATDAGVVTNGGVTTGPNPALQNLLHVWGTTLTLPGQDVSFVRTISTNPQFPGYNAVAVFESYNTPADGIGWLANTTPNNLDYPSTTSSYYSVALVSTSPVPLPAAAWLLLTGLGGLGAFAKRPKALLA